MQIQPFQINVPQAVLDDLQKRLARTRWTDEVTDSGWNMGTNLDYMKELADYWQHQYDWRKQEARLNSFNWFKAEIDGTEIPFIHERGKGPNPTPIILFHGWPDSVCRYLKLIPMLTDPASYGGDPQDSFDVIVPALVGFGNGPAKEQPLKQIAELSWRLMTAGLGYQRFAAGGGDGGSPISQLLGVHHPGSIIGLHLTDLGFAITMGEHANLSEAEQQYLEALQMVGFQEGAYAMLQGTKPQTLAYGLNDSPVGFAAWIIEKIHSWSDCDGDLEKLYSKDELLTNIMLYWVNGPSVRAVSYREEWVSSSLKPDQQVDVPVAVANPPKDINPVPPREFAERNLKNLQRWTVLAHGGHFAAWEYPELMAQDMRAFFRDVKAKN
jgi:pimeloyl-ACP methyl ester carboxylesterase